MQRNAAVLQRLVLIVDALVLPVSAALAFAAHDLLRQQFPFFREAVGPSEYAVLVYLAVPVWVALDAGLGLDRVFQRRWTPVELFVDLVKVHLLWLLALTVVAFVGNGVINRSVLVLFLLANLVIVFLLRLALGTYIQFSWTQGGGQTTWLLVGAPSPAMQTFLRDAQAEPFAPKVLGVLVPDASVGSTAGAETAIDTLPTLGAVDALSEVLRRNTVDAVIFFPPLHHPDVAAGPLRQCEEVGISAAFAVDFVHRYPVAPRVVSYGTTPCITFDWVTPSPLALAVKHAFDVVAAAAGLLLVSPLLLVVALAVRVSMGGPVFFTQERVGLHGRRFRMVKFRTMVRGAEAQRAELAVHNELSGPVFKMTEDPRVTPLGAFLRKWSIDELPQLFNVLVGSMSLVGPRPLPVSEQMDIAGWYRRRLSMKPGITGLWQVSGRSNVDFDEWMRLDLRYVETWSLANDAVILLKTLPAVASRRGAK